MFSPADMAKNVLDAPIYTIEQKRLIDQEKAIMIKVKNDEAKKPAVEAFKARMATRRFEYNLFFDRAVKPVWSRLYEAYWMSEDAKKAKALGLTLQEAYALYLPHKLEKKNK